MAAHPRTQILIAGVGSGLRSERGREIWDEFLKSQASEIFTRAKVEDSKRGIRGRASSFKVPDAKAFLVPLPDLVHNWPGSTAAYGVGDPKPKHELLDAAGAPESLRTRHRSAS
jgi:hypothetical protein